MEIRQGDVFWVSPDPSNGIASEHRHPYVVLAHDHMDSVVLCGLTSNLKRAKEPGNVLLEEGEADLPHRSVVVVSQMYTVNRSGLGEYIGTLTENRVDQVLAGLRFLKIMVQHHT
jgi:mRNA interferase MazF